MELELELDPVDGRGLPSHHSILQRTTTVLTTSSNWTVSYILGKTMQLDQLTALIQAHSSLQRIEIASTEGYKQKRNGILHRFLILELRRSDKSPVWLRIDRRMHPDTTRVSFVLASGESPAYDTVHWI